MSPHIQKPIITLVLIACFSAKAFAWSGFDNSDGSEIEINSGNLVREGEEIKFYDWKSEEDRIAEVLSIDYLFNRTRLEIFDFIEQKNRIFEME